MLPFAVPSLQERPQIVFSPLLNRKEIRLAERARHWKGHLALIAAATVLAAVLCAPILVLADQSRQWSLDTVLTLGIITFLCCAVSSLTVARRVLVLRWFIRNGDAILLSNGSTSDLYFAQLDRINGIYTRVAAHKREDLETDLFKAVLAMVRREQIMRQQVLPDGLTYNGLEEELRLMRNEIIAHIDTYENPPTQQ